MFYKKNSIYLNSTYLASLLSKKIVKLNFKFKIECQFLDAEIKATLPPFLVFSVYAQTFIVITANLAY